MQLGPSKCDAEVCAIFRCVTTRTRPCSQPPLIGAPELLWKTSAAIGRNQIAINGVPEDDECNSVPACSHAVSCRRGSSLDIFCQRDREGWATIILQFCPKWLRQLRKSSRFM
eukprot:s4168_g3.t1